MKYFPERFRPSIDRCSKSGRPVYCTPTMENIIQGIVLIDLIWPQFALRLTSVDLRNVKQNIQRSWSKEFNVDPNPSWNQGNPNLWRKWSNWSLLQTRTLFMVVRSLWCYRSWKQTPRQLFKRHGWWESHHLLAQWENSRPLHQTNRSKTWPWNNQPEKCFDWN